ncbi:protein of unknown function [Streptomyces sp. OV198]|jgi:hypothetical protein|uniref:DUF4383 domain-containing protein n=1 Tax=unclassified Streptomyces TaxID=2593676 RepID=UPI000BB0E2E3|nr:MULTISPECIES: DUF4383 domain-containing protein [unclassified Streptomyces]PBC99338.1 uncharacterized protein DUF4383 [Streptomyces sp. Ag82_O1-15]SOE75689.1 protein of unknown function [Streptomyces sp. OV198]
MATHVLRPGTRRRIAFDDHLPVDHRLNTFYRIGAGLMGLFLLAFGILGLTNNVGFFTTHGDRVIGLNTNGSLSVLSICVGLLLFVGMVIGGNFASTLNMVFGVLFILNGFLNLALLDGRYNFLAFRIQNVLFSFVVGVLLMFFGMYGRVGSALPHDNPYYKARHPEEAERTERIRALRESASATALQQSHRAAPTPKAVGGTETKAAETTEASESKASESKAAESRASETKAPETKAAEPPRTTDP